MPKPVYLVVLQHEYPRFVKTLPAGYQLKVLGVKAWRKPDEDGVVRWSDNIRIKGRCCFDDCTHVYETGQPTRVEKAEPRKGIWPVGWSRPRN